MENGIELKVVEQYVQVVIPNIESGLADSSKSPQEKLELYNLYLDILKLVAPYDFISFNKYYEIDEDKTVLGRGFYHHRKNHLAEVFTALNDMEIYNKYDMLLISMPPRVGKTTTGIRFLAWIAGRYPEFTQLAISYSDNITTSFYNGVMEIVQSHRFQEVFSDAPLKLQNAKREEIWLKTVKRYPTLMFIPINGSMTGRGDAKQYIYMDDLVSGLEEALSVPRLTKLWGSYTVDAKQRKSDGCREIHIATRWSVHDPITKLANENADNPRCKIISMSCYNEEGESNFDFFGGFSTQYYRELEKTMDSASFGALYKCEPIEREGLLYHEDEMQYYFDLPNEPCDTVVAVCDSKNLGKDYVASPIAHVYGDMYYIDDVVYNSGLPDVTKQLVANKWCEHKVVRGDIEMNNGGNYYAEDVDKRIHALGGKTSVRTFYTGNNKDVKIITYADFVKKHFVFRDKSTYSPNSEYAKFMKDIFSWTQTGKNPHDDAPDSIAMLAKLAENLQTSGIRILDRRKIGI